MSQLKCDFCSEPTVEWRYPTESFVAYSVGDIVGESVGDWAACAICHLLIVAGDREALARRCISKLVELQPALAPYRTELTGEMRRLHAGFFNCRSGAAVAHTVL